ncbi:MAG: metallophosphoesterase [Desulforhopalus sp.]|nr:metallophosphoesterase [Desulforhopalus sp.]
MTDPLKKILEPIKELQNIRGIDLPIGLEFLQLVVTGPPGAGKSYYIEQIRGWPNEGYLDLTQRNWWKDQSLVFRPREVHLGLPFQGFKDALTVFDKEWLSCPVPPGLDYPRIRIPPTKRYFFQTDWRNRYIFEFLIPNPSTIYQQRLDRQDQGYFPVDDNLSIEMVRQQVAVYREMALYLHRAGLNVYIRKSLDKPPLMIAEKGIASVPRWTLDKSPRRPSLRTIAGWKYLLRSHNPIRWITLDTQPLALESAGRIAHDGRSFELHVGDTRLRFQPDIPIGSKKNTGQKNWIITSHQGCSHKAISGFLRIRVGETIVIGRNHKEFRQLFQLAENVAEKHVSVTNDKGDLILTPLVSEVPTQVLRHDDHDYREQLALGRHKALLEIGRLYGQTLAPMPPEKALATLKKVNALLSHDEPFRPKNRWGKPGGLVEIPADATPVIVGDLHAQVNNLLKILSENCLLDCLKMKNATLIILGDAVHSEMAGEIAKFDTSMLIMDIIFQLKLAFPGNVFYIRGNHDSFDPEIHKGGVMQGILWREALLKQRGEEYVREMEIFYGALPYLIRSESFIACHAGPPRDTISREDLINIADKPLLAAELVNTRLHRPGNLSGYTKGDVKRFRKGLDLAPKTRFIVGHTPMDPFGSFWLHAGSIKNHHVIYSAHAEGPSIIIRTGATFNSITFPSEPLTDIINDLM